MTGLQSGPRCYIPSYVEIGSLVPEKIFEGLLPYMGVAVLLVHVPSIMLINSHLHVPKSLHSKNGAVVSEKSKFSYSYVHDLEPLNTHIPTQ